MSLLSQIVSDDQHCLCKAGQWDKVSQCQPPAGSVSESEGPGCCVRRKLLSHDPRCRISWKRPTSRRPLLLWSAPSGTRDALQEVADVDFQKEERTNFRPTKEFGLIYECPRDLYMGCNAFQTSGRITQPGSKNYLLNVHVVSSSTTMLYQHCWVDFPSGILITSLSRFADNLFIDIRFLQQYSPKG